MLPIYKPAMPRLRAGTDGGCWAGLSQSRPFTFVPPLWAAGGPICYPASMAKVSLALWRDRRGRVSALRIVTLILLLMPIALAVMAAFSDQGFGARPLNDLIH